MEVQREEENSTYIELKLPFSVLARTEANSQGPRRVLGGMDGVGNPHAQPLRRRVLFKKARRPTRVFDDVNYSDRRCSGGSRGSGAVPK